MKNFFAGLEVGRKNIIFGVVLFLLLGVVAGIPLSANLFRGSMLGADQYQTWKVLHAYGVFTAFVNFFFGFCIDRQNLTRGQKEIASWSFLAAGIFGGIGRPLLHLLSVEGGVGSYTIDFIETAGFVLGTFFFLFRYFKGQTA
jgi:hypothetical protein